MREAAKIEAKQKALEAQRTFFRSAVKHLLSWQSLGFFGFSATNSHPQGERATAGKKDKDSSRLCSIAYLCISLCLAALLHSWVLEESEEEGQRERRSKEEERREAPSFNYEVMRFAIESEEMLYLGTK